MKNIFYTLVTASLMLGACHPTYIVEQSNQPAVAPQPVAQEVSYQNFYDELSPYGHWIDYPGYGYVWMPSAGPDFRPYSTNGNWIYTDMGWTWTSNYSWGWAPFHYGRWFYEGGYGWMWMPGNEWSPAWVSWRSNNDYYGWAPLGPNVRMDAYGGAYNPPSNYWCFVPHQYISSPRVSNYYVNESRNVTIINNTTVINTRVVNVTNNNTTRNINVYGPDRQEVERATGTAIRPAVIRENNRPGEQVNNGQYTIYRPRVNAEATRTANNQQVRVAPSRVESLRDMRPASSAANLNAERMNNINNNNSSNNQPAIRSSNNNNSSITPSNTNNNSFNNNNSNNRPSENPPTTNIRQQQNVNNNPPVNNRFNNNNNSSSNANNNNLNNTNSPANVRTVNTRPPANDGRPANNIRTNNPGNNNNAPANNNIRNNSNSSNNVRINSAVNNNNSSQNNNRNANQLNQMRKPNTTDGKAGRPTIKKEE
ncbi:MAG: hypothetical protein JST75_12255 [Bacteroidetes bacterium]|nr:hypothetical protein [Bacteroidota bacterium]